MVFQEDQYKEPATQPSAIHVNQSLLRLEYLDIFYCTLRELRLNVVCVVDRGVETADFGFFIKLEVLEFQRNCAFNPDTPLMLPSRLIRLQLNEIFTAEIHHIPSTLRMLTCSEDYLHLEDVQAQTNVMTYY